MKYNNPVIKRIIHRRLCFAHTIMRKPKHTYLMYCSDLLYFFARYLAEALLGILTKDSSLLYLVMLHGVSHTQKSLSLSTRKSGERKTRAQLDL